MLNTNTSRDESFQIDIRQSYQDELNFNDFAKQIRYARISKEEIMKLKEETILYERIKRKRAASALLIQKNVRGFLSRRKFRKVL